MQGDAVLSHRGAYGRHGHGQYAMRAAHGSASLAKKGDHDLVDVERVETHGRRYYVDDGVDGTHLVEVDHFRRSAVRLRLRLGQDLEYALGRVPCALGQRAGIDDGKNIGQTAMLMVVVRALVGMLTLMRMGVIVVVSGIIGLLVRMGARGVTFKMAVEPRHVMVMVFQLSLKPHVEVAGAHTVLCHLAHDDLVPRERQTCERLAQALLIGPQIEQGCDDHVAADARRAFEIEGLSHEMILSGGGMTCR